MFDEIKALIDEFDFADMDLSKFMDFIMALFKAFGAMLSGLFNKEEEPA